MAGAQRHPTTQLYLIVTKPYKATTPAIARGTSSILICHGALSYLYGTEGYSKDNCHNPIWPFEFSRLLDRVIRSLKLPFMYVDNVLVANIREHELRERFRACKRTSSLSIPQNAFLVLHLQNSPVITTKADIRLFQNSAACDYKEHGISRVSGVS